MNMLHSFNTAANKLLAKLMFFSFSIMVILVFFQVIFRYAIQNPLPWTEEVARYFFIWATYLGASIAFYEGTHINVTLVVNAFKSIRVRAFFNLLADFACMSFLAMFVVEGFIITKRIFDLGQFSPSLVWLPIGVIYLALPLGSVFMILNVLSHFLKRLAVLCSGVDDDKPSGGTGEPAPDQSL